MASIQLLLGTKWQGTVRKKERWDEGTSKQRVANEEKLWQKIWKLDVKKKIQHFIWKACHNRIPMNANLKKRGMKVDTICKQCGEAVETTEHLFFSVPKLRRSGSYYLWIRMDSTPRLALSRIGGKHTTKRVLEMTSRNDRNCDIPNFSSNNRLI